MEEEIYIEESNPRKVKIVCIILLIVLSIFFLAYLYFKSHYTLTLKTIKIEAGEKLSEDLEFYLENKILDKSDYTLYLSDVPTNDKGILDEVGEYTYKVRYKNITKKGKFIVKDTVAPSVETVDLTIGVKEEYDIGDFILECNDYSRPCDVSYKDEDDANLQKKAGNYDFKIVVSDSEGNKVTKTVRLNVKKNYSYENKKKSDLKVDHIDPDYKDWNNKMILTYSKGVNELELDEDDRYQYLLDLSGDDLNMYLPVEYSTNHIEEAEIIFVYNKYDYIIGYAIRVKIDTGEYLYLTK